MKDNDLTPKAASQCSCCEHLCCNYITTKIDAPRTIRDFDGLLWQVSHENIQAFRDHTGWHLIIHNKCSYLKPNGVCSIYEERPITCREYSLEKCDYNGHFAETSLQYFENARSLNDYCSKRFKAWNKRFNK